LPMESVLLRDPHLTQPVFVRFPRAAVFSGTEGVEKFPPSADRPFAVAVLVRLRRLVLRPYGHACEQETRARQNYTERGLAKAIHSRHRSR